MTMFQHVNCRTCPVKDYCTLKFTTAANTQCPLRKIIEQTTKPTTHQ